MWIFAKFTSSPSGIDNEGMALFPEKYNYMKEIKIKVELFHDKV